MNNKTKDFKAAEAEFLSWLDSLISTARYIKHLRKKRAKIDEILHFERGFFYALSMFYESGEKLGLNAQDIEKILTPYFGMFQRAGLDVAKIINAK